MEKLIFVVVNHNGISMTVVAYGVEHACRLVKDSGYAVTDIREIGTAYPTTEIGVVE